MDDLVANGKRYSLVYFHLSTQENDYRSLRTTMFSLHIILELDFMLYCVYMYVCVYMCVHMHERAHTHTHRR